MFPKGNTVNKKNSETNIQKYFDTSLLNICNEIEEATEGSRNNTLSKNSFIAGQIFQGIKNIASTINISEFEVKGKLMAAADKMVVPLPGNESISTIPVSFQKGKVEPRDLSFLLGESDAKNNYLKLVPSTKIIQPDIPTKTLAKKIQIRWITEDHENRFSFIDIEKLISYDPKNNDVDKYNQVNKKFTTLEALNKLNIKIYDNNQHTGLTLWGTNEVIYNPNDLTDSIHVEGRTDLISAVSYGLDKYYKLVSHFNKTAKIEINDNFVHIFCLDADVNPEDLKIIIEPGCNPVIKKVRFDSRCKDLSDWIYYGFGSISELQEIFAKTNFESTSKVKQILNKRIMTANDRLTLAMQEPVLRKVMSEIVYENELVIIFGDTGCGKSLYTVQLCDSLSRGSSVFNYINEMGPLKILAYDFELSDRQFLKRYSNESGEIYNKMFFSKINVF